MKNVYIIHGWEGSPKEYLHVWLKTELEKKGFNVLVPKMPNPSVPIIKDWVNKIKEISNPNENSVFIGHSIGCQAILRFLETLPIDVKIAGMILIAPWMSLDENTIKEEGEEVIEIARPWMETPINFSKVKTHCSNITAIFSDNDPYVPIEQKNIFEQKLDANIIIEHNKGHFTVSDNIRELPSALEAVIKIFNK